MRNQDKFRGCLIGGAAGDALGFAVEFMRDKDIFRRYGEQGITEYLVKKMLRNTQNNAHIQWLTGSKVAWRFMTAGIRKRDFFGEE